MLKKQGTAKAKARLVDSEPVSLSGSGSGTVDVVSRSGSGSGSGNAGIGGVAGAGAGGAIEHPQMLVVSCRFVPTDQWFISHVRTCWTVKDTKAWLLSRCMPAKVPIPPDFRPPSPVTFATTKRSRSRMGTGAGAGVDDDSDDDVDDDMDDEGSGLGVALEKLRRMDGYEWDSPDVGDGDGEGMSGEDPDPDADADSVSDYGSVVDTPPLSDPEMDVGVRVSPSPRGAAAGGMHSSPSPPPIQSSAGAGTMATAVSSQPQAHASSSMHTQYTQTPTITHTHTPQASTSFPLVPIPANSFNQFNFSQATFSDSANAPILAKAHEVGRDYSLHAFNGQRLEENLGLDSYHIPPFSMIEIHRKCGYVDLKRQPSQVQKKKKKAKINLSERQRQSDESDADSDSDDPYLYPYFEQKICVWSGGEKFKDGKASKYSKGNAGWKKAIVMIWHGSLYIIEFSSASSSKSHHPHLGRGRGKRRAKSGQMNLLVKRSLDDLAEIGDNTGVQDIWLPEDMKDVELILVRFHNPRDEVMFAFKAENANVYHDLLRVLHRSHPDPSTRLKTSFIRPLTRMPTFAKPKGHITFGSGDYNSLYDFDDDDLDDGAELMSINSGKASTSHYRSQDSITLNDFEVGHESGASASAGAGTSMGAGTSTRSGFGFGASATATIVGSVTSQVPSEMRLDSALPYPEWRRDVVARAREVCRGHRYPFSSPCGHSLTNTKPHPVEVGLEGLTGSFTITMHGQSKSAALCEYFRRIKDGEIRLEDLQKVSLSDMIPKEFLRDTRLVDGEEGLKCPEEDDAPSENEWDSWKADIERQKPRKRRYAGLGGFHEDEEAEVRRYHPGPQGAYYSHHSPPGIGKRPSPINIDSVAHHLYGIEYRPSYYEQVHGYHEGDGGSAPRSRSQSGSTPAGSPLGSPLAPKPSLSRILQSGSPKGESVLRRVRSKTLGSPSLLPSGGGLGQNSSSSSSNMTIKPELASPRVIPPSPMGADNPQASTATLSSVTLPTHGSVHQTKLILGKSTSYSAAGRLVGKIHRPRSSNQVCGSSGTQFGISPQERDSIFASAGKSLSNSMSAFSPSPGTNTYTSPGFTTLEQEASASFTHQRDKGKQRQTSDIAKQSSSERIKDKGKEKEKDKEKERKEGKEGKGMRTLSVIAKKTQEKFVRGFDDALDFVDGR